MCIVRKKGKMAVTSWRLLADFDGIVVVPGEVEQEVLDIAEQKVTA